MRSTMIIGAGLATAVAASSSAAITGFEVVSYSKTVEDFGGVSSSLFIQDMYAVGKADDVLLNVYNMTMVGAPSSFFQSATGTGWLPNNLGSIFDTQALQEGDSFVTIGGFAEDALQVVGAGSGTGLDPNFGGSSAAAPGALAGWFNSSPPNLNGLMGSDGRALVGRFSSTEEFNLEGTTLEATWNQGIGTAPQQGAFTVTPAPGALALLGLAGIAGRRRRG